MKTFYIQSYYQYPVTFSSIGKTIPARSAQGELRNVAEFTEKEIDTLKKREPFFRELVDKKKIRVLDHLPSSYVPPAQRINEANDEAEKLRKELEAAKAKIAELEAGKGEGEGATTEESSATETEDKEDNGVETTSLEATSYEGLKEIATKLGIEFKANVKKADLIKMIKEAEAKAE
jgi:hypothetical protein